MLLLLDEICQWGNLHKKNIHLQDLLQSTNIFN